MNYSGMRTVDALAFGPDWSCLGFDFSCSLVPSSRLGAHSHEVAVGFFLIIISNHKDKELLTYR